MSLMLVTGGAGFIGSHLVERLLSVGHEVRVLDDFSTGREENIEEFAGDITLHRSDVRDLEAVRRAVEGVEVVFHEAALASVPRSVDDPAACNDVNVRGTLNVLTASKDAGVRRLIYASSSSIYGDSPELPKRENMAPAPASPYAVAKLAAEYYCRVFESLYGLETVCLRYFNVFGPRQDPESQYAAVVPIFLRALLTGEAPVIYGDGEQSRDFTYVANVVDGNLAVMEGASCVGKAFNVACGTTYTVNALFEELRALTGADVQARHVEPRAGDVRHSFADITRAATAFDFEPKVPFQDGLKKTVRFFRAALS